jgi:prepilin-type N-terminal cleavage/methylation domain-containing protein
VNGLPSSKFCVKYPKLSSRGFTRIELLVVIAIIGVLSSVVLASMNSARKKARDARAAQDLRSLMTALNFYYDDNGCYQPNIVPSGAAWERTDNPGMFTTTLQPPVDAVFVRLRERSLV